MKNKKNYKQQRYICFYHNKLGVYKKFFSEFQISVASGADLDHHDVAVEVIPVLCHDGSLTSTSSYTVSIADEVQYLDTLILLLLNMTCPVLANSVDPDQLASEDTNLSGSALFVIKYVNFY